MENLLVSLTNLTCLLPLYTTIINKDYYTFMSILFVSLASVISHLVENHKHGMPGYIVTTKLTSYYWNKLDVFGCLIIICRLSYLFYNNYRSFKFDLNMLVLISPVLLNLI